MRAPTVDPRVDYEDPLEMEQINVPPQHDGRLWKVITRAVRCPRCGSTDSKALTGKRLNGEGLMERYHQCPACELRFRVVLE